MCGDLISGLANPFFVLFCFLFFQSWLSEKKSSSTDPERPEKAIISVSESYLVHFGSFKPHIRYLVGIPRADRVVLTISATTDQFAVPKLLFTNISGVLRKLRTKLDLL